VNVTPVFNSGVTPYSGKNKQSI